VEVCILAHVTPLEISTLKFFAAFTEPWMLLCRLSLVVLLLKMSYWRNIIIIIIKSELHDNIIV